MVVGAEAVGLHDRRPAMDPYTPQVTSSCFASECSVVPQAAKGLSKEDIQLLLTAKEADNTGD